MKFNKKVFIKIAVPIVIVIIIIGIWAKKNKPETEHSDIRETNSQNITETEKRIELPDNLKNADFSLAVQEMVDYKELSKYGIPIIVDYGSDSCIPCQQMAPALETLNKEFTGKAFVKFVDVWEYQEAASNVPLQVIPTQVLFNSDGTPFVPSKELSEEIEFSFYNNKDTNEHAITTHQGGLTEEQLRKILKEMGAE